jgi:hypothetical protein
VIITADPLNVKGISVNIFGGTQGEVRRDRGWRCRSEAAHENGAAHVILNRENG